MGYKITSLPEGVGARAVFAQFAVQGGQVELGNLMQIAEERM